MGKQVIQIGHKQGYTGKEVKSEADYVKEAKQRLNDKVADFRNMANELFLERENLYRESPNSRAIKVMDRTIKLMARCSVMIREIIPLASAMSALSKTLDVFNSVQDVVDTALDAFQMGNPGPFANIKQSIKVNKAVSAIRRKLSSMQQSFGMYPKIMSVMDNFARGVDKAMDKMDKSYKDEQGNSSSLLAEDLRLLGIEPQNISGVKDEAPAEDKKPKNGGSGGGDIPDPNDYK